MTALDSLRVYQVTALFASTAYDALGGITDEEVRVHLEHTDTHRRVAVVFGRSATSLTPNRINVRGLRTFDDVDDKRASAAISAALVAIRNHPADVAVPNTHIPCPRCEGQGDLGDVEGGRPCPLCSHGTCSPEAAADWIDAVLMTATASWGTTRAEVTS